MFFRDIVKYAKGLPVLILSFFLYGLLRSAFNGLALKMGASILVGFARWFLLIAIMTHFAGLMNRLFKNKSLSMEDLSFFDNYLMGYISRLFFIFYLIEFVGDMLIPSFKLSYELYLVIVLIWGTIKAPGLEASYISSIGPEEYFRHILKIWKENPVTCAIYTAICVLIYINIAWNIALYSNVPGIESIPYILLNSLITAIFFFTKGILYKILVETSPRSRAYKERNGQ